jgi:sulfur relay (sulfurtransferase) complex TusBCD TusD component (DsrE family)
MANYLIIESRDPFDSNDVANSYELAVGLAKEGNAVTLFLVQNGVLPARKSKHSSMLGEVAKAGVEVLADEFSLRERGMSKLIDGVRSTPLDVVVDRLADGSKAIWH